MEPAPEPAENPTASASRGLTDSLEPPNSNIAYEEISAGMARGPGLAAGAPRMLSLLLVVVVAVVVVVV